MQIEQITTALREGLPFAIVTAAGNRFTVKEAHQVAWPHEKTRFITVVTEDGLVHLIQLLTITNITYLGPETSRRGRAKK
jgi:hypothetical protein